MGSILSFDDIEIGQAVAFQSCFKTNGTSPSFQPLCLQSPFGLVPAGAPMRVKGMSLPFDACEVISPDGAKIGPAIVIMRRVRICQLSDEYVNAIVNTSRKIIKDDPLESDIPS